MSDPRTDLLIEVDKKLGILIDGYESDKIAISEFKKETKNANRDLTNRITAMEKWQAGMMVDQKTISSVKDSIVKWVIGSMLTLIGSSTIIISILLKGGA